MVGDSFAYGQGVPEAARLGSRIRDGLSADGAHVDLLPLATPGLAFPDEAVLYDDVGEAYAPDVVVWVFVLNDLGMGAAAPTNDFIVVRDPPPHGSALGWLARRAMVTRAVTAQTVEAYRGALTSPTGVEVLTYGLRRVVGDVRARGGRFVFVIFPLLHDLDAYPFADGHADLARVAAAEGAEVVDLLGTFQGRDASSLWVSNDDHHPNAAGHAIAADAILAHLRAHDTPLPASAPRACPPAPPLWSDDVGLAAARDALCADPTDGEAWLAWGEARKRGTVRGIPFSMDALGELGAALADKHTPTPDGEFDARMRGLVPAWRGRAR